MKKSFNYIRSCLWLLLPVAILVGISLTMIHSTSCDWIVTVNGEKQLRGTFYMSRQLTYYGISLPVCLLIWRLRFEYLRKLSPLILFALWLPLAYLALCSLLYAFPAPLKTLSTSFPLVPFTRASGELVPLNGAFRWLKFGSIKFQPSEFAKPALILFLASYFSHPLRSENRLFVATKIKQCFRRPFFGALFKPLFISSITLALILLGRDVSSTVIVGTVVLSIFFLAGIRIRTMLVPIALAMLVGLGAVLLSENRRARITKFFVSEKTEESAENKESDATPKKKKKTKPDQRYYALLALGHGGIWGCGLGNSLLKQEYLPESHTDFILAIIGEEQGFFGISVIIVIYVWLVFILFRYGKKLDDRQLSPGRSIILSSLGILIGVQAFLNLSVVSGLFPVTGVTAPFLSYGGSSALSLMIAFGFALSATRVSKLEREKDEDSKIFYIKEPARKSNGEAHLA